VLDHNRGDVLLDMRQAGPVHGLLTAALAAAVSRARNLGHRIVVIDRLGGAAAGNLRRYGPQGPIPIYPDPWLPLCRRTPRSPGPPARHGDSPVPAPGSGPNGADASTAT
jgi:hypothetical protein